MNRERFVENWLNTKLNNNNNNNIDQNAAHMAACNNNFITLKELINADNINVQDKSVRN